MVRRNILEAMIPAQEITQRTDMSSSIISNLENETAYDYVNHPFANIVYFVTQYGANGKVYELDCDTWKVTDISGWLGWRPFAIAINSQGNYMIVVGSGGNAIYTTFSPGRYVWQVWATGTANLLLDVAFFDPYFGAANLIIVGSSGTVLAGAPPVAPTAYNLAIGSATQAACKSFHKWFAMSSGAKLLKHDWLTHQNTELLNLSGKVSSPSSTDASLEYIEGLNKWLVSGYSVFGSDLTCKSRYLVYLFDDVTGEVTPITLTSQNDYYENSQRASLSATWRPIRENNVVVDYEITVASIVIDNNAGGSLPHWQYLDSYLVYKKLLQPKVKERWPKGNWAGNYLWTPEFENLVNFAKYGSFGSIMLAKPKELLKLTTDPTRPMTINACPTNNQQQLCYFEYNYIAPGVPILTNVVSVQNYAAKLMQFVNGLDVAVTLNAVYGSFTIRMDDAQNLLTAPVVIAPGATNVQTLTDSWSYIQAEFTVAVAPTTGNVRAKVDMRV